MSLINLSVAVHGGNLGYTPIIFVQAQNAEGIGGDDANGTVGLVVTGKPIDDGAGGTLYPSFDYTYVPVPVGDGDESTFSIGALP